MMESDSGSDVSKLIKMGDLSVPPGFASLTSFVLKRGEKVKKVGKFATFLNEYENEPVYVDSERGMNDINAYNKRPWILLDRSNNRPDQSHTEHLPMDRPSNACRPKGTIRGCSNCNDCLKVAARWHPDDARREVLEEAPVFNPTEEEFEDTLKYIASIRSRAEHYGCCRIIPPTCWKPPCSLVEKNIWEGSEFVAQVQRIDGLQVQHAQETVASSSENIETKRRRDTKVALESQLGNATTCALNKQVQEVEDCVSDPGPKFTLKTFKKFADEFKTQYFKYNDKNKIVGSDIESALHRQKWEPSVENIEGEYGRIVQNPTEEIEVLCGNTLEAGVFSSGFPKIDDPLEEYGHPDAEYLKSGWNLNNIHLLPGSLISFESPKASRNFAPQVHVGMCFSSLGWQVEEHQLYFLSYMHLGEPKVWYCVPRRYAVSFETIRKKYLLDRCEGQPDVHENLMMQQFPCSILKAEGIPIYRCVQYPHEFVLILSGAYHSGFDCGFNCSESVGFAPLEWLLHGQNVMEQYCEQRRKTLISYDKLLLEAARKAVRAQWETDLCMESTADKLTFKDAYLRDEILAKALGSRIRSESLKREYLCKSLKSQRMDKTFDAFCRRVCSICLRDLHLSAVGCFCSENKFACLDHAKQLCPCTWSNKILLYRYDISELNVLHQALEGKLSSVYKWAKEDLGLSFVPAVSKRSKQTPEEDTSCSMPPPSQDSNKNGTKSKLLLDTNNAISKWKQQKLQTTLNSSEMKQNEVASQVKGARRGSYRSTFSIQPKARTASPEPKTSDKAKAKEKMPPGKSTISKKVKEDPKVSTTASSATNLRYMSFLQENALLEVSSDSTSSSSASESDDT